MKCDCVENKEKATLAAQAKQASSMKENPSPMSAQTIKKKRKVEEEGTPLATKTPRVREMSEMFQKSEKLCEIGEFTISPLGSRFDT